MLLEFVPSQIKHYIIRYKRYDADECRQAFIHAEAETDEKHGQKQEDGDEVGQHRRLVALPDGHGDVDLLHKAKSLVFWAGYGQYLLGLLTHATGTLGVTGSTGTLRQYLDFQFVVGDFGDDALVGNGLFFVHCAFVFMRKITFFSPLSQKPVFLQRKILFMTDKKKKEPGKFAAWIKEKYEALRTWYHSDDNFMRKVHFPGTKVPLLDVLIDFIKLFTKGRTMDRAAGVAFNFFLALFPLVLFFFTLIPYIPIPHLYERVMMALDDFLIPSGTMDYVRDSIDGIMNQPHEGLLSLSIFLCLIFGSSGVVAIFNGFRNVYANYVTNKSLDLKGWLLQRTFAVLMLIIIGLLLLVSILLISLGGTALVYLVKHEIIEGGSFTFFLFSVLRWVIGVFALCLGIALLYFFGNYPYKEHYRVERKRKGPQGQTLYRNFVIFSPGAILATGLFILGTVGFNIYISNFSRYNVLYGSIGTLIILMMWIWIVSILILAGNDLNSGIRRNADKQSPDENEHLRREIVIEDLKRHIQSYQGEIERRTARIDALRKQIAEQTVLIQNLEEENKKSELIIKEYERFVQHELKRSDEQSMTTKLPNNKKPWVS